MKRWLVVVVLLAGCGGGMDEVADREFHKVDCDWLTSYESTKALDDHWDSLDARERRKFMRIWGDWYGTTGWSFDEAKELAREFYERCAE